MVKVKNWAYVVLSRVCTGLLPGRTHSCRYDFRPNPDYLEMMQRLRNNILVKPLNWNNGFRIITLTELSSDCNYNCNIASLDLGISSANLIHSVSARLTFVYIWCGQQEAIVKTMMVYIHMGRWVHSVLGQEMDGRFLQYQPGLMKCVDLAEFSAVLPVDSEIRD
jgi:hypothetical protein